MQNDFSTQCPYCKPYVAPDEDFKQFILNLHLKIAEELQRRGIAEVKVEEWWPTLCVGSRCNEIRWEEDRRDGRDIRWIKWWINSCTESVELPFDLDHELSVLVEMSSDYNAHADAIEYLIRHHELFDALEDGFIGHDQWKELKSI